MQDDAFLRAIAVNECSKRRAGRYLDHFYPGRMRCCVGLAGGRRGLGGSLCGRFLGGSRHEGQGQGGENKQDGGRTGGGAASLCSSQNQRASHVEKRDAHGRNSPSIRPQNVQSHARHQGKRDVSQRAQEVCAENIARN